MLRESGFLTKYSSVREKTSEMSHLGAGKCPHFCNRGSLFQSFLYEFRRGVGSFRVRRESMVLRLIWRFSRHFKAFNRSPLICPDNTGRRDKSV